MMMYDCDSNTREALLRKIDQMGFAVDDTQLYLDTHTCDTAALAYFNQVSEMYRNAVATYEAQFGPLMAYRSNDTAYWSWIEDPWPWEGGQN